MKERTRRAPAGQPLAVVNREAALSWIRQDLKARMHDTMLHVVETLFKEEVEGLCGPPWSRKAGEKPKRGLGLCVRSASVWSEGKSRTPPSQNGGPWLTTRQTATAPPRGQAAPRSAT